MHAPDYRIRPWILPLLHPPMGSALRASLQLFKSDPIEFSTLRFIQARR